MLDCLEENVETIVIDIMPYGTEPATLLWDWDSLSHIADSTLFVIWSKFMLPWQSQEPVCVSAIWFSCFHQTDCKITCRFSVDRAPPTTRGQRGEHKVKDHVAGLLLHKCKDILCIYTYKLCNFADFWILSCLNK